MVKDMEIHGVDISKDVFDVFDHKGCHHQFSNGVKGFAKYLGLLGESSLMALVKKSRQRQLTNLKSIPGLGDKTAGTHRRLHQVRERVAAM